MVNLTKKSQTSHFEWDGGSITYSQTLLVFKSLRSILWICNIGKNWNNIYKQRQWRNRTNITGNKTIFTWIHRHKEIHITSDFILNIHMTILSIWDCGTKTLYWHISSAIPSYLIISNSNETSNFKSRTSHFQGS